MCLLAFKPKDKEIKREHLAAAFEANSDGAGMSYVDNGELMTDKGYCDFDSFYEAYKLVAGDRDMMIHFRAASPQMLISEEMCHPFVIDDNRIALEDGSAQFTFTVGHNGRLPWNPSKEGHSDTYMFTEEFLSPLLGQNPYFLDFAHGRMLLEKFVGDSNKLLIFRFDRETKELKHYIVNPKGGVGFKQAREVDGVWYSNDSYIPIVKHVNYRQFQGYCEEYGCGDGHYPNLALGYGNGGAGGSASAKSEADKKGEEKTKASGENPQASKGIVDETAEEIARSIQSSDFGVDQAGWYWDFSVDCWRNKNTGHCTAELMQRPKKPRYMITREINTKASADRLAAAKAKEAAKSPPSVNANWPEVKAGAVGKAGGGSPDSEGERFRKEGIQMRIDLSILSDDEFEVKWGVCPLQSWREAAKQCDSNKPKPIVVPRDAGVLEDDVDDVDEIFVELFDKKQQKIIMREASKFWASEFGGKNIREVPKVQRLKYMLQMLRNMTAPNASTESLLRYVLRMEPSEKEVKATGKK